MKIRCECSKRLEYNKGKGLECPICGKKYEWYETKKNMYIENTNYMTSIETQLLEGHIIALQNIATYYEKEYDCDFMTQMILEGIRSFQEKSQINFYQSPEIFKAQVELEKTEHPVGVVEDCVSSQQISHHYNINNDMFSINTLAKYTEDEISRTIMKQRVKL